MQIINTEINLVYGDITTIEVDAVVNAANSLLLGGGGVDGAIHSKGGRRILEECMVIKNKQGGCKVGEAVYTSAGMLPAKYVVHTVGPLWNGGDSDEPALLANCYFNSLMLAEKLNVKTIAFPNISTGVYRYPKVQAAQTAFDTVKQYLSNKTGIRKIYFVCFDRENYDIYKSLIGKEENLQD